MKNNNFHRKLLIVGTTPKSAGIGGVTIHVERLLQYLDKVNFKYELFDYKIEPFFKIFRSIIRSDVIHIHVSNHYYRFFLSFICTLFRKTLILTLHGKYVKKEQKLWPLIHYAIRKATVPIVLNQVSYDTCIVINSKTILIPAFIPPQKHESLDIAVAYIVNEIHAQGKKIAVTYGFDDSKDNNGQEVYGVSFLLPIFDKDENYRLIVADPSGCYKNRYARDFPNVYFIDYSFSLYELLKVSDIFIRNTSKDGDSLSVKEAIYLGKKVICSDAIERPSGVLLFTYSDEESFMNCLYSNARQNVIKVDSGENKLLDLYKTLV